MRTLTLALVIALLTAAWQPTVTTTIRAARLLDGGGNTLANAVVEIAGTKIVTSLSQIQPGSRTPEALREQVRQLKTNGADVIKIFASASTRDGGKMNVTQEQLDALCGEAKTQGLRTIVHAQDPPSNIASVKAGCTQ